MPHRKSPRYVYADHSFTNTDGKRVSKWVVVDTENVNLAIESGTRREMVKRARSLNAGRTVAPPACGLLASPPNGSGLEPSPEVGSE